MKKIKIEINIILSGLLFCWAIGLIPLFFDLSFGEYYFKGNSISSLEINRAMDMFYWLKTFSFLSFILSFLLVLVSIRNKNWINFGINLLIFSVLVYLAKILGIKSYVNAIAPGFLSFKLGIFMNFVLYLTVSYFLNKKKYFSKR